MIKKEKGITLIALIITIIVLLILAGITIATLTGDNGLLTKTGEAKESVKDGEIGEQIRLAYKEWQMENMLKTSETVEAFLKRKLRITLNNNELNVEKEAEGKYIVTTNGKDYILTASSGSISSETAVTRIKKSTEKADSYVGYYADIDKDGIVDGVIFVDLLTGSIRDIQKWRNSDGVYTLPTNVTTSNVNTYYISQESYTWAGITKPVISPKTLNGSQRFYIMDLRDFTTPAYTDTENNQNSYPSYTSYFWYNNAYGHMNPLITATDFGTGKENTRKMIEKWNASAENNPIVTPYTDSAQNKQDIWKHVQTKYNEGWFIPSRAEWSAFINELGIITRSTGDYNTKYNLSHYYWSSSQENDENAWLANLYDDCNSRHTSR